MENKSASQAKKPDCLTISYTENVSNEDIENLLYKNDCLKLVKKDADLNLDHAGSNYTITTASEKFQIKDNFINLKNIVDLLIQKNKQLSLHKEKKIKDIFSKKLDKKKYSEWNFVKKELKVISSKSTTLHEFPEHFLNSNFFKNYLSAMVFIHEKGSKTVDCYTYEHSVGSYTRTYSIESFNKLFSTIKKSKSKSFSLTTSQNLNLDFAGSFLGKEYNFTTNNAILLLSRNDFLTPSIEEINQFDTFCDYLKPVIAELITREKNYLKYKDILNTIERFPLPLLITNKNNEVLFSNLDNNKNELLEKIHSEDFDINIFSTAEIEQSTSDVFHFQRISLLGELLNTLKHELSNPLFGMYLTSTLLEDSVSEDNAEVVVEIQHSIKRSQDIIDNISTLYKSDSSQEDINLVNIFQDIFLVSKSETKSIKREIITNDLSDEELTINSNPTWISQVLFNLIINSAQAMKSSGTVSPEINVILNRDDKYVSIQISDNGPGLKNVNPEDIFKPFFTTKKNGTGLGLNITKNLLSKLNGTIDYISEPDNIGATFLIKLPR